MTMHDFDLFNHTCLLTRAGSRAYGINTATSDVDVKGICIPPVGYYLGMSRFEQADSPSHFQDERFLSLLNEDEKAAVQRSKIEGSIYDFRKMVGLLLNSNPNSFDVLFCADEDILKITPAGQALRDVRDAFVSAKCRHTLAGYAFAQVKRIDSHRKYLRDKPPTKPTRTEYGLAESADKLPVSANQLSVAKALVRKRLDEWEPDLSLVPNDGDRKAIKSRFEETMEEIVFHVGTSEEDIATKKWRAAVSSLGFDTNFAEYMEKERRYDGAMKQYQQYTDWKKNRNVERAKMEEVYGFDLKHAGHVYRLLKMGMEILTTGKVHVNRRGIDADVILDIRRGGWTYEQLMEFAEETERKLTDIYLSKTYVVPHSPDTKRINKATEAILMEHFGVSA